MSIRGTYLHWEGCERSSMRGIILDLVKVGCCLGGKAAVMKFVL